MTLLRTTGATSPRHPAAARSLFFDHAFLPDGWASNVRLTIEGGFITDVTAGAARGDSTHVKGIALPGLPTGIHTGGWGCCHGRGQTLTER